MPTQYCLLENPLFLHGALPGYVPRQAGTVCVCWYINFEIGSCSSTVPAVASDARERLREKGGERERERHSATKQWTPKGWVVASPAGVEQRERDDRLRALRERQPVTSPAVRRKSSDALTWQDHPEYSLPDGWTLDQERTSRQTALRDARRAPWGHSTKRRARRSFRPVSCARTALIRLR